MDIKGSKYMLVHSLASKYARFVVLGRLMYWTPPPSDHLTPPLLKSDDLFLGNQVILDPPCKNPGHAPEDFIYIREIYINILVIIYIIFYNVVLVGVIF